MSQFVAALKSVLASNFTVRDMTSAEEMVENFARDGVDVSREQVITAHVLLPHDDTVVDAVLEASRIASYHSSDAYAAHSSLRFAWDVELRFTAVPDADNLDAIAAEATEIAEGLGGRFDGWSILQQDAPAEAVTSAA